MAPARSCCVETRASCSHDPGTTAVPPPLDELNGTRWALDPRTFDDTGHGEGKDGGWSGWTPEPGSASAR